jgi:outer membrane receptor for ferrienterochelin and colicins
VKKTSEATISNNNGSYSINNLSVGKYEIAASYTGYKTQIKSITITDTLTVFMDFDLEESNSLDEVVITGTLKPVSRMESPVPVEVYKAAFFKKNPTASIFEAYRM